MKPKVIFIVGPTASGKSSFGLEKARELGGEIINADSRQIYKDLIIGTASPSEEEKSKVSHHLYNFLDVDKTFSAVDFVEHAEKTINEVLDRGKQPIVVGGTGLYLDTLIFGYKNPPLNKQIREEYEKLETEELYKMLQEKDPDYTDSITPNSRYYIVRALEIIEITGKPRSEVMQERREVFFEPEVHYISHPREKLWERIQKRVDIMWQYWLEEVEKLIQNYPDWVSPAFTSLGYKEIRNFIEGNLSKEETKEKIFILTRQYAKRQETWFRRENWKVFNKNSE